MKSSASVSKPLQSRSRADKRLGRSKLKEPFLIIDAELFMYLIHGSAQKKIGV